MKTEKDFEQLKEYVRNWRSIEGIKPSNEEVFIDGFLDLIRNYPDEREVEFDGEGAYFGKQVTLRPFSIYGNGPSDMAFEVAYSEDKLSVYTANNNGFWWPEYIRVTSEDVIFYTLKSELINFLKGVFGV